MYSQGRNRVDSALQGAAGNQNLDPPLGVDPGPNHEGNGGENVGSAHGGPTSGGNPGTGSATGTGGIQWSGTQSGDLRPQTGELPLQRQSENPLPQRPPQQRRYRGAYPQNRPEVHVSHASHDSHASPASNGPKGDQTGKPMHSGSVYSGSATGNRGSHPRTGQNGQAAYTDNKKGRGPIMISRPGGPFGPQVPPRRSLNPGGDYGRFATPAPGGVLGRPPGDAPRGPPGRTQGNTPSQSRLRPTPRGISKQESQTAIQPVPQPEVESQTEVGSVGRPITAAPAISARVEIDLTTEHDSSFSVYPEAPRRELTREELTYMYMNKKRLRDLELGNAEAHETPPNPWSSTWENKENTAKLRAGLRQTRNPNTYGALGLGSTAKGGIAVGTNQGVCIGRGIRGLSRGGAMQERRGTSGASGARSVGSAKGNQQGGQLGDEGPWIPQPRRGRGGCDRNGRTVGGRGYLNPEATVFVGQNKQLIKKLMRPPHTQPAIQTTQQSQLRSSTIHQKGRELHTPPLGQHKGQQQQKTPENRNTDQALHKSTVQPPHSDSGNTGTKSVVQHAPEQSAQGSVPIPQSSTPQAQVQPSKPNPKPMSVAPTTAMSVSAATTPKLQIPAVGELSREGAMGNLQPEKAKDKSTGNVMFDEMTGMTEMKTNMDGNKQNDVTQQDVDCVGAQNVFEHVFGVEDKNKREHEGVNVESERGALNVSPESDNTMENVVAEDAVNLVFAGNNEIINEMLKSDAECSNGTVVRLSDDDVAMEMETCTISREAADGVASHAQTYKLATPNVMTANSSPEAGTQKAGNQRAKLDMGRGETPRTLIQKSIKTREVESNLSSNLFGTPSAKVKLNAGNTVQLPLDDKTDADKAKDEERSLQTMQADNSHATVCDSGDTGEFRSASQELSGEADTAVSNNIVVARAKDSGRNTPAQVTPLATAVLERGRPLTRQACNKPKKGKHSSIPTRSRASSQSKAKNSSVSRPPSRPRPASQSRAANQKTGSGRTLPISSYLQPVSTLKRGSKEGEGEGNGGGVKDIDVNVKYDSADVVMTKVENVTNTQEEDGKGNEKMEVCSENEDVQNARETIQAPVTGRILRSSTRAGVIQSSTK